MMNARKYLQVLHPITVLEAAKAKRFASLDITPEILDG